MMMRQNEWAVILAGGDGARLKALTRKITGDERPKQFCCILEGKTLLEQTRRRIALQISPERTFFVINGQHKSYYELILADTPTSRLVVQPSNRGTTPAILYSLLRIAAVDSEALVAFFPSDHYISDEHRFMRHIRVAFDAVRARPEMIALLGIHPLSPEVEYGWIEPSEPILTIGGESLMGVSRFWEKPDYALAKILRARGCLWNSFVMVTPVRALLNTIQGAVGEIYSAFSQLHPLLGTGAESQAATGLYQHLKDSNFSYEVLALWPERFAVIKVDGVMWSDLGEPQRVMALSKRIEESRVRVNG
ncbi:MAG TPA: sugar phosphate nucleotidyltransferase [Candidatus Sulfotelmatobacter sp.]|nr:sugar phosphate nucleotidyltransferase [Candidatus Sulfotelmatobacter sp.]